MDAVRIITVNVNGVRAAASKGLFDWLQEQRADVVCLQETKAQEHQLADPCFRPLGQHCFYFDARRPGYAGTAPGRNGCQAPAAWGYTRF